MKRTRMSKRVACPGCSCLCDGLIVEAGGKIPTEVEACSIGSEWFRRRFACLNDGQGNEGEFGQVVEEAATLLSDAKSPLITGIENLSTQAQQAAVKVADRFRAIIDSGWSDLHRGSMLAFQRYGKITATLGEITSRCDVVIFWFCDPQSSHPRFVERFLRSETATSKQIIVIDQEMTATAKIADEFIQVNAGDELEFVQKMRQELLGDRGQHDGDSLAQTLAAARYGSVFVGKPSKTEPAFDVVTDQWFQLVRTLNDHTRFVMGSLPSSRNGVGASNVLASLSGFPDAVRFTDQGPVHNGLEYSTTSILNRRECDMLLICDAGVDRPFDAALDADMTKWLKQIPVVVLSDFSANEYRTDVVHVPVGATGWTTSGDYVRCDDVPIPMDAIIETNAVSAAEFFESVLARA